mgnify:CR=1 FL=1
MEPYLIIFILKNKLLNLRCNLLHYIFQFFCRFRNLICWIIHFRVVCLDRWWCSRIFFRYSGWWFHIFYYIIFSLIDIAGAALAFAYEKENHLKLFWMLPQRLIYRQLMYYILIKSFNKAIKGELQGWGALKRTGRVKDIAVAK